MTQLTSAREELAELNDVLNAFRDAELEEWSPQWITMRSLLKRQVDLLHEIRLLEGAADIEITLSGGAEDHHSVAADFLGGFIQEFQAAVGAIAQTFVHGERGSRGTLPLDVLGASALRVSPVAQGSFVLLMDGPRDRVAQFTMEGGEQIPPFDEAVQKILDLLGATEVQDYDALRAAVAEIGSHRALVHVSHLARSLARTHTAATVVQRSTFIDSPREARITGAGADRLEELLSRTIQTTTTVYASGRLSGVLWRRGVFELELGDEQNNDVITGRVIGELRALVQPHFDTVVTAELERTVTVEADQQVRTTYRLVGLGSAPSMGLIAPARHDDGTPLKSLGPPKSPDAKPPE